MPLYDVRVRLKEERYMVAAESIQGAEDKVREQLVDAGRPALRIDAYTVPTGIQKI